MTAALIRCFSHGAAVQSTPLSAQRQTVRMHELNEGFDNMVALWRTHLRNSVPQTPRWIWRLCISPNSVFSDIAVSSTTFPERSPCKYPKFPEGPKLIGPLICVSFRKYFKVCGSTRRFAGSFLVLSRSAGVPGSPNSICSFTLLRLDNTPTSSGGQCNQSQGSAAACSDVESSNKFFSTNVNRAAEIQDFQYGGFWYPPAFPNSSYRRHLTLLKYQEVKGSWWNGQLMFCPFFQITTSKKSSS